MTGNPDLPPISDLDPAPDDAIPYLAGDDFDDGDGVVAEGEPDDD